MKRILSLAVGTAMLLTACQRDNGYNNNYNSTYNNNSNLSFWMAANCSTNPVSVKVNGQTSQITEYYPNGAPSCPGYGCANFYLPAGTYSYTATATDTTWTGSVTVGRAGCVMQQLQCVTGNVTFWVDSAADNTKVTLTGGGSSRITVAFPTTTPGCGTSGCANFTLPGGTYSYTAVTSTNIGYTGSVTVVNDSCRLIRLY